MYVCVCVCVCRYDSFENRSIWKREEIHSVAKRENSRGMGEEKGKEKGVGGRKEKKKIYIRSRGPRDYAFRFPKIPRQKDA